MYILKRLFALLLVLVFLSTACISAMAEDFDVSDAAGMQSAFSSSDTKVNIKVTQNINMSETTVTAQEGKTYNVSSDNNSSLSNVSVGGSGTVNINTDVKGTGGDNALSTYDSVTVTVTGTVSSTADGVAANDNSKVTVNGNIDVAGGGVRANGDSTVKVTDGIKAGMSGVRAYDDSNVEVNGNIEAGGDGVYAVEYSNVTVNGNVTGGSVDPNSTEDGTWGGDGVFAGGKAAVSISGNVTGGSGSPNPERFGEPDYDSNGGEGIWAVQAATVNVGGDVKGGDGYGTNGYAGHAIYAGSNTSVTVGGNAIGGDVTANPSTEGEGSLAGDGVWMESTATVKVGGNAIGGSTNGNQGKGGSGAYLKVVTGKAGSLTVGGQVKAGNSGVDGERVTDLYTKGYGNLAGDLPAITMGACGTVGGYGIPYGELTQEQLDAILAQIKITGLDSGLSKPEGVIVKYDLFWTQVVGQIRSAEPGSELTVDVGNRTSIPVYILNAAAQRNITLIIQWNGGPDIVVKNAVEVTGDTILLSELAKLVK